MNFTKAQKQLIINDVTNALRSKQWFNGCGFEGEKLIVAYNFYPAFETLDFRTIMLRLCPTEWELRDIKNILPNAVKDDVPPYVK